MRVLGGKARDAVERVREGSGARAATMGVTGTAEMGPVQALDHVCSQKLPGTPGEEPEEEALESIGEVLQRITPESLGLEKRAKLARGERPVASAMGALGLGETGITCQHVNGGDRYSIDIFCIPKGKRLPLHDHPGMNVFSMLVYGRARVRSFDWKNEPATNGGEAQEAEQVRDEVVEEGTTLLLHPRRCGNLHEFTAVTTCAFLDVLTPPYDVSGNRECTYYEEQSLGDGKIALKVASPPPDFRVSSEAYCGEPPLVHP